MASYEFYRDAYCGSRIPESAFAGCAARAAAALAQLERCYVIEGGPDSRRLAICAMADELWDASCHRGLASRSVGSVSEHYVSDKYTDRALWRALYRQAAVYLDIYRGIGPYSCS